MVVERVVEHRNAACTVVYAPESHEAVPALAPGETALVEAGSRVEGLPEDPRTLARGGEMAGPPRMPVPSGGTSPAGPADA